MSDGGPLTPRTGDIRQARTPLVTASPQLLSQIQTIKENTALPRKKRREMIESLLEAAIRIDAGQMAAFEQMMQARVETEKDKFILEVRNDYNQLLGGLGISVEKETNRLLRDFAKWVTQTRRDIQEDDMEDNLKKVLMKDAMAAFHNVRKKMIRLAGGRFEEEMAEGE